MLDALNITEEEALGLAELAQHDLALARSFAARAQAAEDADEANRLARSYQRAARSYRQTLALKARLQRDLAAAAHAQANTPRPRPGGAAVARRLGEVRTALLRLAWGRGRAAGRRAPGRRAGRRRPSRRRDLRLVSPGASKRSSPTTATKDSFCDDPLDDHVARLAIDLGFAPDAIARWRDLPDPPRAALDVEPDADWRSSA
jgi:hypothetical protein